MVKRFNLSTAQGTKGQEREEVYNALDCIATFEIDDILEERMLPADKRINDFYMALQAPAMDMMIRGILVDEIARQGLYKEMSSRMREIEKGLAKHPQIQPIWDHEELNVGACNQPTRKDGRHKWEKWDSEDQHGRKCVDCGASRLRIRPFKVSSDDDVMHLAYDLWKCKPQLNKDGKRTVNKEAREKLVEKYPKYEDAFKLMSEFADVEKQQGFLKFRSPDGRFYSAFNVSVTETGRWSSNQDHDGNGSNAQNITERHRHIFTADPGYKLCYADLKQAESKVISFVAGDEAYIEAHELGDTHTYVCRLVWPEGIHGTPWTGNLDQDKAIATSARPAWDDKPGHDYRFQSKAIQHGSNLGLTPFGMAIQKRIPVAAAQSGQARYFKAFPGIGALQRQTRKKVEASEPIISPLGARFKLYGRPWDEHTYKQALSKIPQSMVGHIVAIGLFRIFCQLHEIKLLAQVHDAILMEYPIGREDLVYAALQLMEVPVNITGVDGKMRRMTIGVEAAVGTCWGHYHPVKCPDGIREITFHGGPNDFTLKK
jgi:DNA polymerase I-like protein with 3'-5' exonuclease and polymerase domains